jgi:hypothetical protein
LRSRLRATAAVLAFLVLGLPVACQPGPSPSAPVAATVTASASAPGQPSPPASSSTSGDGVDVDVSLLSILPPVVAGVAMQPALDTSAEIAADPSLAGDVEALAVGLFVAAGSSAAEDLVIASVVRLQPDVFNETFFRGWRDSYDAAACEPAGGLHGNAETEMDGRQVFIGSCANGAFTYHLRYGEDVIVSLTSIGEGRFGEQVVQNLGE